MKPINLPAGLRLERLSREHPRGHFASGEAAADRWLTDYALQQQSKHLSATKVLLDPSNEIAGFYTLATGQVHITELPPEAAKRLPNRDLPVAVLAWLAVDRRWQRQGLGDRLLVAALRDCWEADKTFPFIAVVLDCLNESVKAFYQRWDFSELTGQPLRLFLTAKQLAAIVSREPD